MIQLTDAGRQALRLQDELVKATQRIAELEAQLRKILLASEHVPPGFADCPQCALEREAWTVLNGENHG